MLRLEQWRSRLEMRLAQETYFQRLAVDIRSAKVPNVRTDMMRAAEFEVSLGD